MEKKLSKIRFSIHNRTFFKHFIFGMFYRKSKNVSKREKAKQKLYFNYRCNCDKPTTFNEYLLWIKYYYKNDLWKRCADKLACKEFLIENGFEKYVPKTLGIYHSSKEIDLSKLPDRFILKTNHDSGSVFLCEKGKTDFEKIFSRLDDSMKNNYVSNYMEWFYEDIKPLIFAEELLIPSSGNELLDYKFFTFSGKYRFGFIASNRRTDVKFSLFEEECAFPKCEYSHLSPKNQIEKPSNFRQMVDVAESVGKLFDFVRVDLYNTSKGIMIGELTFCSMSGFGAFTKKRYDYKYGEYFKDTIFYNLSHNKN